MSTLGEHGATVVGVVGVDEHIVSSVVVVGIGEQGVVAKGGCIVSRIISKHGGIVLLVGVEWIIIASGVPECIVLCVVV